MFHFKKTQCVAIDLGTRNIEFAFGEYANGKLRVHKLFIEKIDDDIYQNGTILKPNVLGQIIKQSLKKHHVRTKNVILTFESSEILKREIIVPKVDRKDLLGLITYQVSHYLPIDVTEYVLEYTILETLLEDEQEKYKVILIAMPKTMAQHHFDMIKSIGLKPYAMDINGNALKKLIMLMHSNAEDIGKTQAYIDFGHSKIEVNILQDNIVKLNRILEIGMHDIDKIISNVFNKSGLDAEQRRFAYAKESLLDLKNTIDVSKSLKIEDEDNKEDLKAQRLKKEALEEIFDYIDSSFDEVEKVFNYYKSRKRDNFIDKVYVYGGASSFKDFNKLLEMRLNIPTEKLDISSTFEIISFKEKHDDLSLYINALGALVRIGE